MKKKDTKEVEISTEESVEAPKEAASEPGKDEKTDVPETVTSENGKDWNLKAPESVKLKAKSVEDSVRCERIESIASEDTRVLADLLNEIREDNEKQMKYLKKQLRVSQFFTVFLVVILTIVIFQIMSFIPKVNHLMEQTETMMTDAQAVMKNIDAVTKELKEADLAGMLEDVDSLVVSSEKGMADAMNQVMEIDIESLNQAIKDLQSVVAPLAKLFGRR